MNGKRDTTYLRASKTLDEANAVMERWKRTSPATPGRRSELEKTLTELRSARKPISDRCRCGRHVGRKVSTDDPYRVLNRELGKAVNRLRSMIRPTTGTPYKPTPAIGNAEFEKEFKKQRKRFQDCEAYTETIIKHLSTGEALTLKSKKVIRSTYELRAEATQARETLTDIRAKVKALWFNYDKGHIERRTKSKTPYVIQDEYDKNANHVSKAHARITELDRKLRTLEGQREARVIREDWDKWTVPDCVLAWQLFNFNHDRWPTAREHNEYDSLPYYTQLRRAVGPRPMQRMKELVGIE